MCTSRSTTGDRGAGPVVASVAVAVAASALFTVIVHATTLMDVAYSRPQLDAAVETAAALISLLVAQLLYGRFRQSLQRRDLLLTAALGTFAATNLCFSAIPAVVGSAADEFATWTGLAGQLLGALLFAAAAVAPDHELRRPAVAARRLLGWCGVILVVATVLVAVAGDALPLALPADPRARDVDGFGITGNAAIAAGQGVITLLMAVAVVGFTRLAIRGTDDQLSLWLAIGAAFGTFARLNYLLFPSLLSHLFYSGDILRLGFVLALAVGAVLELGRTREVIAAAAIEQERRRVGRDVHDGVAQDLAYIVQQGRRLLREPEPPAALRRIVVAAERALDESRHVVAALARPGGEPFAEALARTAEETVGREGGRLELEIPSGVSLPADAQEALLRVVREALINARRHGRAETMAVRLQDEPLRLTIDDDGKGFDVAASFALPGHFGLKAMEARVREVGGALEIDSVHGRGTRVEIVLP